MIYDFIVYFHSGQLMSNVINVCILIDPNKGKVCIRGPSGRSLSWFQYFYSPLDGMLVHRRVTPSIKFAGTHLYTWVKRGTVTVKCLAQEHNTMSPARAQTQSTHSRVQRTNHEATTPPLYLTLTTLEFQ